jgi:5'-nucleotidase
MVCSNGDCALSCQGGLTECGDSCRDLQTDRQFCGGCTIACDPGEVCSRGDCSVSCQDGLTECNGGCRDVLTDHQFCGDCDTQCGTSEDCVNGRCVLACQKGFAACQGECVDTVRDERYCGACTIACGVNEQCIGSECLTATDLQTPVSLQFLTLSDWHGQIDPVSTGPASSAGGASALAAYFEDEETANPNTLIVAGGDSFGASPPISSQFDEIPSVRALDLMGLDFDVLGNHNFDRGLAHLQAMINMADYKYVGTNLTNLADNVAGVSSTYDLVDLARVRIAIIGVSLPETADLVMPDSMGTINVKTLADTITAAMAAKDAAAAQGARVFVALAHIGAKCTTAPSTGCAGPLIDFATGLTGFNLVVGGHSHFEVSVEVNNALVVQSGAGGTKYGKVTMDVVPADGTVNTHNAALVTATTGVAFVDPAVNAMIAEYRGPLSEKLDVLVGAVTDQLECGAAFDTGSGRPERLQEMPVGNLVAEALRSRYGTELALVNGGGLRAPLPSSYAPVDKTLNRCHQATYACNTALPDVIVLGDIYTLLPFSNMVVTRDVTGHQLWQMVTNGISGLPTAAGKFPQIAGFRFTYSTAAAPYTVASISLVTTTGNVAIADDTTTYTLATVDYVNNGGDGYSMLNDGQGLPHDLMSDVVADYVAALPGPIDPTTLTDGRIAVAQ